jgi:hypothetical protein
MRQAFGIEFGIFLTIRIEACGKGSRETTHGHENKMDWGPGKSGEVDKIHLLD